MTSTLRKHSLASIFHIYVAVLSKVEQTLKLEIKVINASKQGFYCLIQYKG